MRPVENEIKESYHEGNQTRIIPNDEVCESIEDVKRVIGDMGFEKSCVDMGWAWQVEEIFGPSGNLELAIGYRLRTSFLRPDRNTGLVGKGWGGWHELPFEPTLSAVVKRCFVACKMILEHELMESLKWQGQRVFDPHNTVQELATLNPARYTRSIP